MTEQKRGLTGAQINARKPIPLPQVIFLEPSMTGADVDPDDDPEFIVPNREAKRRARKR